MLFLKILALIFLVSGFSVVFASRLVVSKFNLDRNMKCDFEEEMSDEEVLQYKYNKAVVNVKMLGLLIALPGLVLVLIAFR